MDTHLSIRPEHPDERAEVYRVVAGLEACANHGHSIEYHPEFDKL